MNGFDGDASPLGLGGPAGGMASGMAGSADMYDSDGDHGGDRGGAGGIGDVSMADAENGPPQAVYNLQPPLGVPVTTPSTMPQAYPPPQMFPKQWEPMLGAGTKGPDVLFRIQMGLRSGVRSETDWCLSTLLTFTTARNFELLKARGDIMHAVVDYIYTNWDEVTRSRHEWDDSYAVLLRRQKVLEALLIIRNVCIDQSMAVELAPRTAKFVEAGARLPGAGETGAALYAEMRLLCLEVCEHVCFLYPAPLQASDAPLFGALIDVLSAEQDKALLMAALRSVTRLLITDAKESSALLAYPKVLQKVVRYLLVDDVELVAAVLDLLAQVTARLQRVEQLAVLKVEGDAASANTAAVLIVRHLIRLLSFRIEQEPLDYIRLPRRARRTVPLGPPEISDAILRELLTMPEPDRAVMWIRSSYQSDPEGEVLQVSLWSNYQQLFEPHEHDGTGERLLKAIDFIRTCTTSVRGAQAKVINPPEGPKKFIIKGLIPRERALPLALVNSDESSARPLEEGLGAGAAHDGSAGNAPATPSETASGTGTAPQWNRETARGPPVYALTAVRCLQNIARLQGGRELLQPLAPDVLSAVVLNPQIAEPVDKLLTELRG